MEAVTKIELNSALGNFNRFRATSSSTLFYPSMQHSDRAVVSLECKDDKVSSSASLQSDVACIQRIPIEQPEAEVECERPVLESVSQSCPSVLQPQFDALSRMR